MANKWFAAILGFLVPPLAFLYLAKLRIAVVYLKWSIIVGLNSILGFMFGTDLRPGGRYQLGMVF